MSVALRHGASHEGKVAIVDKDFALLKQRH